MARRILSSLLITAAAPLPSSWSEAACPVRLVIINSDSGGGPATCHPYVDGSPSANTCDNNDASSSTTLSLTVEGLEYLSLQPSPLYIVPALGVYRGGKSLLLNRAMGLKAPYSPNGFGVGHEQRTHTRGIDVCAEQVEGLGTVVWMDTEGLWSPEDARTESGTRLFSLALLFASTVVLNSVKVLNDQFIGFFAEQQQIVRVLSRGLVEEGLPRDMFLPVDLSVIWVLQQPISFNDTIGGNEAQDGVDEVEAFLRHRGDALRGRVLRDFNHRLVVVPVATNDARLWKRLDELPEEDLLPAYVESTRRLREVVIRELRAANPVRAPAVVSWLRLYVDLVNTKQFSASLAVETFQKTEITYLCDTFAKHAGDAVGPLPVPRSKLRSAFSDAREKVEPRSMLIADNFHLEKSWHRRLDRCLDEREADLRTDNSVRALSRWMETADATSEGSGCYFLDRLADLINEYSEMYAEDFGESCQERALGYARRLQRNRLLDCVRLKHFVLPFVPWLVWPCCSLYLRKRSGPGILVMTVHVVLISGLYVILQILHQLPPYLDLEYPILKGHAPALNFVMWMPLSVPWDALTRAVGLVGTAWSVWNVSRRLIYLYRRPGDVIGQMLNLELKMNKLLKHSKISVQQQIVSAALDASESLDDDNVRAANRALLRGLVAVRDLDEDGLADLSVDVDSKFQARLRVLTRVFRLPPRDVVTPKEAKKNKLLEFVALGELGGLLQEMVRLMSILSRMR